MEERIEVERNDIKEQIKSYKDLGELFVGVLTEEELQNYKLQYTKPGGRVFDKIILISALVLTQQI